MRLLIPRNNKNNNYTIGMAIKETHMQLSYKMYMCTITCNMIKHTRVYCMYYIHIYNGV